MTSRVARHLLARLTCFNLFVDFGDVFHAAPVPRHGPSERGELEIIKWRVVIVADPPPAPQLSERVQTSTQVSQRRPPQIPPMSPTPARLSRGDQPVVQNPSKPKNSHEKIEEAWLGRAPDTHNEVTWSKSAPISTNFVKFGDGYRFLQVTSMSW